MSQSKPAIPQSDNVAHALAGAGGGILSMVLTYPLITLSTRAQVESRRASTGFLAAAQQIVAREGAAGLYAGLESAVFGISLTNFVYYYWYEWTRAAFVRAAERAGRTSRRLTTLEAIIAGAVAGSATVILTNPIWVVNTRMTTRRRQREEEEDSQPEDGAGGDKDEESGVGVSVTPGPKRPPPPTTTIGTLLALLRDEGPRALFAGVVPALVLVINPILQYTLFEQLKNMVERRRGQRGITPTTAFVLGALGKLFATSITYPYITVKSQMHVAGDGGGQRGKPEEGMTQAIRRVVKQEGYAGLYKGIGPKLTQSVLTAAFLFAFKDVLYEQTVRLRAQMRRKALP